MDRHGLASPAEGSTVPSMSSMPPMYASYPPYSSSTYHSSPVQGLHSGLSSSMQSGLQSGLHSGVHAGLNSGVHPGLHSGLHSGLQPGLQSGLQSGLPPVGSTSLPSVPSSAHTPAQSTGAGFNRYERSSTPPRRSLSINIKQSTNNERPSGDISLQIRQQPKEALVTSEGKEKARKPVDPPPIIQLQVKHTSDPQQHYLQSPYLFMCASLFKHEKNEPWDGNANKSLAGSLVSSLHRLKDIDNKDGGFFVFGDISVKVQGTFRLQFTLFEVRSLQVHNLGSIISEPFRVVLPKDFKGMDESTYLSRAFSDQGVRLRLRKEPRAMTGKKRSFPFGVDAYRDRDPDHQDSKRFQYDTDLGYGNSTTASYAPPNYASYVPGHYNWGL